MRAAAVACSGDRGNVSGGDRRMALLPGDVTMDTTLGSMFGVHGEEAKGPT